MMLPLSRSLTLFALLISSPVLWASEPVNDSPPELDAGDYIREVEMAGFCANVLALIDAGDLDRAERLLAWRLKRSVRSADQMEGVVLPSMQTFPNLVRAFQEADDFLNTTDDQQSKEASERVLARLRQGGD